MNPNLMSLTTSRSGLAKLAGVGVATVGLWIAAGLPVSEDGTVSIFRAIRWLKDRYPENGRQDIDHGKLSQIELAQVLGCSRQMLYEYVRSDGLTRNVDGSYDLVGVGHWLRQYYREMYARKYWKCLKTLRSCFARIVKELENEKEPRKRKKKNKSL